MSRSYAWLERASENFKKLVQSRYKTHLWRVIHYVLVGITQGDAIIRTQSLALIVVP